MVQCCIFVVAAMNCDGNFAVRLFLFIVGRPMIIGNSVLMHAAFVLIDSMEFVCSLMKSCNGYLLLQVFPSKLLTEEEVKPLRHLSHSGGPWSK